MSSTAARRRPVSWVQAARRYGLVRADEMFPDDEPRMYTRKRSALIQKNRSPDKGSAGGKS